MSKQSKAQQAKDEALEKGFMYLSIASQFMELVADDLRRKDSLLCGMDNERRGALMDSIACLLDDSHNLMADAAGYL